MADELAYWTSRIPMYMLAGGTAGTLTEAEALLCSKLITDLANKTDLVSQETATIVGVLLPLYASRGVSQQALTNAVDELKTTTRPLKYHLAEFWSKLKSRIISTGAGDFINGLLDANGFIQEGKYIQGVTKIDLMGGATTQLGGEFANIDIVAQKRIKGSVTDLDKFIKPNSIEEIVCSNPQAEFISECGKVMKSGSKIYINGTARNPFFNSIIRRNVETYGFDVIEEIQPLAPQFSSLNFYFTDGVTKIPTASMRTTILIKR